MNMSHDPGYIRKCIVGSPRASAPRKAGPGSATLTSESLSQQGHGFEEAQRERGCVNLGLPMIPQLPQIHCTLSLWQWQGLDEGQHLSYLTLPSEHLFLLGWIQILRKPQTFK